jgi:cytochrome c2
MKKILLFLFTLSLFACSNKNNAPQLFNSSMLTRQSFLIDAQKDTSLHTLHGSIIRIAGGSFTGEEPVEIEIREALTPTEILAAGLVTESNGMLLRSGGMIYVNAAVNGKTAELTKAIKVSIPNQYYDSAMQVYKGIDSGGKGINWVAPAATDTNKQSQAWLAGKKLFEGRCAQCHSLFKDMTGPPLAGIESRGPWSDRKELYSYIRNPVAYMEHSRYAQALQARYKSVMTPYPALTNKSIDDIVAYLRNETRKVGTSASTDGSGKNLSSDSVGAGNEKPCTYKDTLYIPPSKQDKSFFEGMPTDPAGPEQNITADTLPPTLKDPSKRNVQFMDPLPTDGMYDFDINTLGWYNIDAYMSAYAGTTTVNVIANLQNSGDIPFNVYLFCPDKQVLSVANINEGDRYSFDKIDGAVPLFLNDRAILFAFGSKGDKVFYGIEEFSIQKEQAITIQIKESTKDAIRQALLNKQMNGIDLGVTKKEMIVRELPCNTIPAATDTTASKN